MGSVSILPMGDAVARPFYPGPGKGEASPEWLRVPHEQVGGDWNLPRKASGGPGSEINRHDFVIAD
jgi:hypothetical protein